MQFHTLYNMQSIRTEHFQRGFNPQICTSHRGRIQKYLSCMGMGEGFIFGRFGKIFRGRFYDQGIRVLVFRGRNLWRYIAVVEGGEGQGFDPEFFSFPRDSPRRFCPPFWVVRLSRASKECQKPICWFVTNFKNNNN